MISILKNKRFFWFLLLFALCFMGSLGVLHAEDTEQEYKLKAAFLVNFARFITWPELSFSPDQSRFTLYVAGKNPFGAALNGVDTKKIGDRVPQVIFVDSLNKVPQCHLLYVSTSEEKNLKNFITRLGQQSVVLVSDLPGFAKIGGSIEFVTQEDRLSFIINHSALKQRGIQVSSSLLNLAASVQ
jgi:hypothetical protein